MPTIQFSGQDAHTLGSSLIAFGHQAAGSQPSTFFRLPRFRLTLATDSPGYVAMCRRALVDDPRFASDLSLDISVQDYETHPEMPRGIWADDNFGAVLFERGLDPAGLLGSLNLDERLMQFFDPATGRGIEALARPGQYPPWVASFPLRNFIHWAYQSIGWRIVHVGTLAIGGRGVLLAGAGGAGKSGTVLAGILAGLDSVGDDYVAMQIADDRVSAFPVMKLMKQDATGLARLGLEVNDVALGGPNWQQKYEFDFESLGHGRRASRVDLHAILMPRIARLQRTVISRATPREAMMAVAPSNLQQLPGGWREGMTFSATLARRLPAYRLDLSEDPREIADVLAGFIGVA